MAFAMLDKKGRCKKQIILVQHVGKVMWGKEEEVALSSTVKLLTKAHFLFPDLWKARPEEAAVETKRYP